MAFTVPEHLGVGRSAVTRGERKVFAALRDHLPEDYLVYYDIPVQGRHPDFIVIGPDLGVVALEVKDWRLQTITRTAPDGVVIKTADGEYVARHPLQQARDYILTTVDLLKQRPVLRADDRLCCGWGYGAVLPSLKTADIRAPSLLGPTLEEVLGPGLVLTGDDLTAERLLPRLRALLPAWAKRLAALTPDQMDEIRGVLYPEIRVGWGLSAAEIFRVMDLRQEQLARSLGDGHQLLRGVAGSGKTIVLVCRARYLREKNPTWRILVLCFNRTLADFLRHEIGADERLDVMTFHAWCRRELQHANITMPTPPARGRHWEEYWEEVPRLLLDAYGRGHAAGGTYQAILVDEGQDFADDWYRAILKALDSVTNRLFIALDSSQNIYERRVSWREIGVQIVGHSRVLRTNYRNTRPILAGAYQVISALDSSPTAMRTPEEEYVVPDRAVRDGPTPEVHRHASSQASRRFALDWVRSRLSRGVPADNILILGLSRPDVQTLLGWLSGEGISASLVGPSAPAASVRISTIHSAKGLDAEHVLLLGGHELEQRDEKEGRRLLYIAMTRAREELCVCYHADSQLMAELEASVAKMNATQ